MGVNIRSALVQQETAHLWDSLQYRQEMHDRLFHSDIYNLAKPHRLTHLVLHQAKYVSRYHMALKDADAFRKTYSDKTETTTLPEGHITEAVRRLTIDGVIICLSTLNVCNRKMSDLLDKYMIWDLNECADQLIVSMGKMAKTVEDIDHMAQIRPLGTMVELTKVMTQAYINLWTFSSDRDGVNHLLEACYHRLNEVERKHIFADQLQTEMLVSINEHRKRTGHPLVTPSAAYMDIAVWRSGNGGGAVSG